MTERTYPSMGDAVGDALASNAKAAAELAASRRDYAALVDATKGDAAAIQRVKDIHTPFRIYDECEHSHTDDDVDTGRAFDIEAVGLTCDDGLMYLVCEECCTSSSDEQSEDCVSAHDHGKDMPYCTTIAALEAGE